MTQAGGVGEKGGAARGDVLRYLRAFTERKQVPANEATARIKINKLLEAAGWRFFDVEGEPANVRLEANVKITKHEFDALGKNFENGFVDFLLLDDSGRPLLVLEAKAEELSPLTGKEQARKYARSQNCRFVLLSNGNQHFFWDLERGNPNAITTFPTPASVGSHAQGAAPDASRLIEETVGDDYIVRTQRPNYDQEAAWRNEAERGAFVEANKLRFLRPYQMKAIHALQAAVRRGNDRFLFEMATGTGKTLTAAAVIKLFLRTQNAHRVLFLVDRLELEEQTEKMFKALMASDYKTVIYKENRGDWRHADIVVSTVQSFLFDNKFQRLFSPTDFDLVISDEAHRSISGNARSVFEHFVGYKLGLTATPRDYLKNFDSSRPTRDPREYERRMLFDTYRTFGCEDGQPTFRYSLMDGVEDGYLINPVVVDARTKVTTELLSEKGFVVAFEDEEGEDVQESYKQREFEKRFYSKATNQLFCRAFLENALRDPISNEMGKSIVFAVSQSHAAKLTQILNEIADRMFPGKYQSDFAVQVTSQIPDAQRFTSNFANNNLLGSANIIDSYHTSKARVCVTVGMMTTGYDCPDILNIGLFRPIFSPTEFIQIKGRGTRRHNFLNELRDPSVAEGIAETEKRSFKLFDFFANFEYFEEGYDYDEVINPPKPPGGGGGDTHPPLLHGIYEFLGKDHLSTVQESTVGPQGMKVDRMLFEKFEEQVKANEFIRLHAESGNWEQVVAYVNANILGKPEEYYTLERLRKAVEVDRRVSLREILEKALGLIPRLKSKDEVLEEEFAKFLADFQPEEAEAVPAMKHFFKAYATSDQLRGIIESGELTGLVTSPVFSTSEYRAVPERYRTLIPNYIKDYVSLNQFTS